MSSTKESSGVCAVCSESAAADTLLCRGCGWTVHIRCLTGARLCPTCSKPLVSPSVSAGYDESHARSKRRLEYRLAGLLTLGSLGCGVAAILLDLFSQSWSGNWLGVPWGTWAMAVLCGFIVITSAAFIHLPRGAVITTGLILYTVMSIAFIPGAYVCFYGLAGGELQPIMTRIFLVLSLVPLSFASVAWWDYTRWKQIPGDSRGAELPASEITFGGLMEAVSSLLPFAVGFWVMIIPQKRG